MRAARSARSTPALAPALGLLAASGLGGCEQCFRPAEQLVSFRVLGVSAEPALPIAGTSVTLTLATVDARPRARAVQVVWRMCAATVMVNGIADPGLDDCLRTAPIATGTTVTIAVPAMDRGPSVDRDGGMDGARRRGPDAGTGPAIDGGGGDRDAAREPPIDGGDRDAGAGPVIDGDVSDDARAGADGFDDAVAPGPRAPGAGPFGSVSLVGFACAGGSIGPPQGRDPSPSCRGTDAQGWLFVHALTYRAADAPAPRPLRILALRFGSAGATVPIAPDARPRVSRCRGGASDPSCTRYVIEIETDPPLGRAGPATGGPSPTEPPVYASYLVDRATLDPMGLQSSLFGPPGTSQCPTALSPDPTADPNRGAFGPFLDRVVWIPPAEAGEARIIATARGFGTGGFAWIERRVVVE